MTNQLYASVALRAPQPFDYQICDNAPFDLVGRRVLVPFMGKQVTGIVMCCHDKTDVAANKIKTITKVLDDTPPLPKKTLSLIKFCADYYHCPVGIAVNTALPFFFRRTSVFRLPTGYQLQDADYQPPPRRLKAQKILTLLRDGSIFSAADINRHIPNASNELRRLLNENIIKHARLSENSEKTPTSTITNPPPLTAAQEQAIKQAKCNGGFIPHLLFGATGTGKTEIYLHLAQQVLAQGKQVLVLTPEINLTPQLAATFKQRFPDFRTCVLHSGITDSKRATRWMQALLGEAGIIVGTRLAVFTPLLHLGLIIVDEEQDDSYKQSEGMAFSARDVAVWRAKHENIPFIAGSATPSLESYKNALCDKYKLLVLNERIQKAKLAVELTAEAGSGYHGISPALLRAVSDEINNDGQVLLFINRRGYAPALICRRCHQAVLCHHCNTRLTWHKRRDRLMCHWCNHKTPPPPNCPQCTGNMAPVGAGTERITQALEKLFPQVNVTQIDSDSLASGNFAKLREEISSGKRRLLVGTRIITKGHDLPKLSLIGILNTDNTLYSYDFRAEERLLAMLSQTIGRGTRNPNGCRIIVQTAHEEHPFYQDLLSADIASCWQRLLSERQRLRLPPYSYLALLKARSKDEKTPKTIHARCRTTGAPESSQKCIGV